MATIHRTTMAPTKLELLAGWLPRQPWYRDPGRPPELARAGGFRLDDPDGEVGLEFMVVTDVGGATYHVPLSYRGAPLAGAGDGLLGTSEHGVLGTRWIYDAVHDPVAVTALLAFLCGDVVAQHQSRSDTPDPSVTARWNGTGRPAPVLPLRVRSSDDGRTTVALEPADDGERLLEVVRVLLPAGSAPDAREVGRVDADWTDGDGSTVRGPLAVVR